MNTIDFVIMAVVFWLIIVVIAYFTSEFIAREFHIPFILVFLVAVFFPPIWLFLAGAAVLLYLIRGGHKQPYAPPPPYPYPYPYAPPPSPYPPPR